jgi:hypothetical protein
MQLLMSTRYTYEMPKECDGEERERIMERDAKMVQTRNADFLFSALN